MSDTPRTDEIVSKQYGWPTSWGSTWDAKIQAHARTLERELAESARKLEEANTRREELRKACAEIIGADVAWPDHGNVELAVAASLALRTNELKRLDGKLEEAERKHKADLQSMQKAAIDSNATLEAGIEKHRERIAQLQQQLAEARKALRTLLYGPVNAGERAIEAAVRAEQHAECVRLLRRHPDARCSTAADWLERRKP